MTVSIGSLSNVNAVSIRRQYKIILENWEKGQVSSEIIATFLKNIESLGFTFSSEVISVLQNSSLIYIDDLYHEIVPILKQIVGADVKYNPMYPNFPKQVMETEYVDLYINALIHYFGDYIGLRIIENFETIPRPPLLEKTTLRVIGLGNVEEYHDMFNKLMSSKSSISKTDQDDLKTYFNQFGKKVRIPEVLPHKEILTFVSALAIEANLPIDQLQPLYKSPTDVLRLATALSDGDVSLSSNTEYVSFSRRIRSFLLHLIEGTSDKPENIAEQMKSNSMKWIRLTEKLHPGDYSKKYPKAYKAIAMIREDERLETFNSTVEDLFTQGEILKVSKILAKRPGVYARRLDYLLRNTNDTENILREFSNLVDNIANPVLYQLINHFRNRALFPELRVFIPKGTVSKFFTKTNNLPPLEETLCNSVIEMCEKALTQKYLQLESLGSVFIDQRLKNYNIPFSQRSATNSMRRVARGSRFDIPEGNIIRMFVYWRDLEKGIEQPDSKYTQGLRSASRATRVDIDISAVMLNQEFSYLEHVSYTNLKTEKFYAVHSGDITSAPEPASEFIDIGIDGAKAYGARYVIFLAKSFTGQPFSIIPECFGGWMIRQDRDSGEIYEPKTVQDKFNLSSNTKFTLPMVFDLEERKVIWTDLSLRSDNVEANNVENHKNSILLMTKSIVTLKKATLFDLFKLHGKARGTIVESLEDADTVFSEESGIQFEFEKIIGEFL